MVEEDKHPFHGQPQPHLQPTVLHWNFCYSICMSTKTLYKIFVWLVAGLTSKKKVPCFGVTLLRGEPVFRGEHYREKLILEYGPEPATGAVLTSVLPISKQHSHSAMLATTSFAFHKLGLTVYKIFLMSTMPFHQG